MSDDAMRNVMDLVGSAPLKDIVSATTDVVEKMCIETAVELTNNNRVAAAEMLGLSRQSLYVKLRKYGLSRRTTARTDPRKRRSGFACLLHGPGRGGFVPGRPSANPR
jgi:hypothetical protein